MKAFSIYKYHLNIVCLPRPWAAGFSSRMLWKMVSIYYRNSSNCLFCCKDFHSGGWTLVSLGWVTQGRGSGFGPDLCCPAPLHWACHVPRTMLPFSQTYRIGFVSPCVSLLLREKSFLRGCRQCSTLWNGFHLCQEWFHSALCQGWAVWGCQVLYLSLAGSCSNSLEERVVLGPLGTWGEEHVIME